MKISKDKLKQIVREELETLTALSERKVKGKAVGNFLKKGRAGRTLTMQGKEYTDLGKGKWKGPDNKKLDWIELSSMASALGDEMVTLELHEDIEEATDTTSIQKQIDQLEKHLKSIHGNSSSVKMKKFAIQKKINKLKDKLEEDIEENRALDNAIANRDANRANRKGIEQYQDLYFGLQKLIRQVSKNNKVKGYGGELTHAFVDLLWAVEDDRLAVGEIFNALKKVRSKISKK